MTHECVAVACSHVVAEHGEGVVWDHVRGELPVSRPPSCCFGGPDLNTPFISTARTGLRDKALQNEPDAGRVFCAQTGVGGVAQPPFATRLPPRSP